MVRFRATFFVFVCGAALLFSCSQRKPAPYYYRLPVEKMTASPVLSETVTFDSLDLELLEWAVFHETNRQRRRLGLSEIQYDWRLQNAARLHSKEMAELDYFDHRSPVDENATVKKRLHKVGIKGGFGGENIAIHPAQKKQEIVFRLTGVNEPKRYSWRNEGKQYTYHQFARDLVRRWLNSAPHRNNILNHGFKFVGVGAVPSMFGDSEVFYVTQNFSSTNY